MNIRNSKILYLIQLPPPVHGVSTINSIVYNSEIINAGLSKYLIELKFSEEFRELRKIHCGKIRKFINISRRLKVMLEMEKPGFVYFSLMPVGKGLWRDLLWVWILKRHDIKLIYHLHNRGLGQRANNPVWRAIYQFIFSGSCIIHLSGGLVKNEIEPLHIRGAKTFVAANGLQGIQSLSSGSRKPVKSLLFFSNSFPAKGIYDALKIIRIIRTQRSDIHLRIAGAFLRDKHRLKLQRLISEYNLDDGVSLAGPRYGKSKIEEFQNADIFIYPSYFSQECFPLVLLEAMSCQLPIVSSNIGAIPEIIKDGEQGLILAPRDIDGFANAILMLADNPELRNRLGKAARDKFNENYTINHIEGNMRKIFEEILTN